MIASDTQEQLPGMYTTHTTTGEGGKTAGTHQRGRARDSRLAIVTACIKIQDTHGQDAENGQHDRWAPPRKKQSSVLSHASYYKHQELRTARKLPTAWRSGGLVWGAAKGSCLQETGQNLGEVKHTSEKMGTCQAQVRETHRGEIGPESAPPLPCPSTTNLEAAAPSNRCSGRVLNSGKQAARLGRAMPRHNHRALVCIRSAACMVWSTHRAPQPSCLISALLQYYSSTQRHMYKSSI